MTTMVTSTSDVRRACVGLLLLLFMVLLDAVAVADDEGEEEKVAAFQE